MATRLLRHWGRPLILIALATLAALSLLPAAIPAAGAAEGPARLRAVHAVPDFGPVDIYVDGAKALGDVPFFTVGPYLELPAGHYRVQVIPAGENIAHPSLFVIDSRFDLAAGRDYSLVARGTAGTGPVGGTLLNDDNSRPAIGQARLRAAHFSPDAPAVDIFIDGARTITNLSFRSATGYLDVPAGTYAVGIAPTGGSPIFTASLTVEAGKVYTAWANGLLGGSGAQAFTVTPSVDATYEIARIRAIHAVPDIAGSPVDVYVNGAKAVTFDFFDVTDYIPVYAGDYDIRVVLAGGDPATEAVIQANVTVAGGTDYSIIARGTGGNFGATVLEDDNSRPAIGQARLRAAHFSPDAPAVDIFVDGARTITNLSFRSATGYLDVPAGTYAVGIAPTGGSPIFTASLTVEAGKVYTAWANGLLGGSGAQAFTVTPSVDATFALAELRLLHAVPDAPAVDVYLGADKVAANLSFGELGDYLSVYAGSYNVTITPAGSTQAVISGDVSLASGKAYTAAATGQLGAGAAALRATPAAAGLSLFDDSAAPAPGKGSLRVVHLSPNAPAVDVLSGDTTLVAGLSFGQSRSLELAPSTLAYRVALAGGGATVLSGRATVLTGSASSIFVLGLAGEAPADQGLRAISTADAVGGAPSARFTVLLPVVFR